MIIKTETGQHEFAEDTPMAKCLSKKKAAGIPINDQAIAICLSETKKKKKKTKTSQSEYVPHLANGKYNFSLLGHWKGSDLTYELQFENNGKVLAFPFKQSSTITSEPITTLMSAKEITCKCAIGDDAGVTRLFGEFSEPIERSKDWLGFEGVTVENKEVYLPLNLGFAEVKNTELSTEIQFDSEKMNGRWLLRSLPNIFDTEFISGDNMYLFWKPELTETELQEQDLKTLEEPETIHSFMQSGVSRASNSNEFEVIVAAEGTWIDRFGKKFIYTKEFINRLFSSMSRQIEGDNIPIGVDKQHSKIDDGKMTELELLETPVAMIKGRGFFNGPIDDVNGASIDAELSAVFMPQHQAYLPIDGVTKRVSLVASPACKLCFFVPKT